jgi:hypothetical protein
VQLLILASLVLLSFAARPARADEAEQQKALSDIRAAMSKRDLPRCAKRLKEAAALGGSEAFQEEVQRLKLLYDYLFDFWRAVDDGGKTLQAGEELVFDGVPVAVVEYGAGRIVVRAAGQNRRYTLYTMPTKLVLKLASRTMRSTSPANKVFLGTFHAMDEKGDRDEARRLWEEARRGGADVTQLMPELLPPGERPAARPPAASPAGLPAVPPEVKALLAPKNWGVRRRAAIRWKREPLGPLGSQTGEGRLVVVAPQTERGDVQVVLLGRMSSDFACRILLVELPPDQVFGLLPANAADGGHVVKLPAGTAIVEFARRGGEYRARVNGEETAVDSAEGTPSTLDGCLGFTLSPGTRATVATLALKVTAREQGP